MCSILIICLFTFEHMNTFVCSKAVAKQCSKICIQIGTLQMLNIEHLCGQDNRQHVTLEHSKVNTQALQSDWLKRSHMNKLSGLITSLHVFNLWTHNPFITDPNTWTAFHICCKKGVQNCVHSWTFQFRVYKQVFPAEEIIALLLKYMAFCGENRHICLQADVVLV